MGDGEGGEDGEGEGAPIGDADSERQGLPAQSDHNDLFMRFGGLPAQREGQGLPAQSEGQGLPGQALRSQSERERLYALLSVP